MKLLESLFAFVIIFIIVFFGFLALADWQHSDIPRCDEDATIVGTGEYAHGRWSGYVCGPSVDDMPL